MAQPTYNETNSAIDIQTAKDLNRIANEYNSEIDRMYSKINQIMYLNAQVGLYEYSFRSDMFPNYYKLIDRWKELGFFVDINATKIFDVTISWRNGGYES